MAPLRDIVRILYFFKNTHSVYLDVCRANFLCEVFSIVWNIYAVYQKSLKLEF